MTKQLHDLVLHKYVVLHALSRPRAFPKQTKIKNKTVGLGGRLKNREAFLLKSKEFSDKNLFAGKVVSTTLYYWGAVLVCPFQIAQIH